MQVDESYLCRCMHMMDKLSSLLIVDSVDRLGSTSITSLAYCYFRSHTCVRIEVDQNSTKCNEYAWQGHTFCICFMHQVCHSNKVATYSMLRGGGGGDVVWQSARAYRGTSRVLITAQCLHARNLLNLHCVKSIKKEYNTTDKKHKEEMFPLKHACPLATFPMYKRQSMCSKNQ